MQIAIHTFDIAQPYSSAQDFKNHLLSVIRQSLNDGARIVLLPEYTAYAATKIAAYKTRDALARLIWTEVFPEVMNLSKEYDALICAGSAPNIHRDTGKFRNRAILAAGGRSIDSYKRCLNPWETDFEPGSQNTLFEWQGLKCALLFSFDLEFPEIATELKRYSPHLVLVPSTTTDHLDHERVHRCASARAVEMGALIAVSALTGTDENNPMVIENIGRCAVYFPAQEAFFKNTASGTAGFGSISDGVKTSIFTSGDHVLRYTIDVDQMIKVKRNDSETKPFLRTLSSY
jgi:predicted amidohydrolase